MDEMNTNPVQPNPPKRRRRRSKLQIFKEQYLPFLIAGAALILIIIFIFGSIGRKKDLEAAKAASLSASELLQQESDQLEAQAKLLAQQYDYKDAMAILGQYTGGLNANPTLKALYTEYETAYQTAVVWDDLSQVPNLSFRSLIQDLDRALADEDYADRYRKNYITTDEFSRLLQELYDNGYVLVSLYDLAPTVTNEDGTTTVTRGEVRLPAGKKPIILTQEAANFFTYMVDGDGDGLADKDGAGFASRLVLDQSGQLTCEMVDASGNTVTGNFDLIPILNDFIAQHPDFSYQGARAIISVCGYDGLFGYRTDPETAQKISQSYYDQQLAEVQPIIEKLRADGYDLASYTYGFEEYDDMGSSAVKDDLARWKSEVTPLLGQVDILVYPNSSDIKGTEEYSGTKYEILSEYGFRYFIGMDTESAGWSQLTDAYARQNRRWITAANLMEHPDWFTELFNANNVLSSGRSQ